MTGLLKKSGLESSWQRLTGIGNRGEETGAQRAD